MESVTPPGGVLLTESTARLVEHTTVLGAPEWVYVKGAEEPLPARRLLGAAADRGRPRPKPVPDHLVPSTPSLTDIPPLRAADGNAGGRPRGR